VPSPSESILQQRFDPWPVCAVSRCVILRETCVAFRERGRLISQLELPNSAPEADLIALVTTRHGDDDLVIISINSLYIRTSVGTYPILKDFNPGASRAGRQEGAGQS
jgi:hypothetical protein